MSIVFWDFGNTETSLLIEDMIDAVVIFLLLRVAIRTYSISLSEMAITFQWSWRRILFGLVMGMVLWLGAGVISDVLSPVLPSWAIVPEEYNFVAQFGKSRGMAKTLLFFILAVMTPVIEEIFFRGLIHSVLKRAFSIHGAIIISSSVFAVTHVYPEVVIISFLMGCSLAWLRERDKSLLGSMIAHTTVNGLSLAFS